MFSAFKERRPWAAATINFIFDPFLGMLYLNRGYIALAYFGIELVVIIGIVAAAMPAFPAHFVDTWLPLFTFAPFRLVGAGHAYLIARNAAPDERRRWYSRWYAIGLIYVTLIAVPLSIRTFLFRPFDMPSGSMSPTINLGDYFLSKRFAYARSAPLRGDFIVFNFHDRDGIIEYAKRIVGLPGDRVRLVGGIVYINGTPPRLTRISDFKIDCDLGPCRNAPQFVETLTGGGPHRIVQTTTDGPLDDMDVVTVPANSYFVLGDNRDNSNDSRVSLGFIAASDIVGKAVIKYIDGRSHHWVWEPIE